jgi:hypothetical protein
MKKNYLKLALVAIVAGVIVSSCGSKKQSLQSTTGQVAIEQDICEKMQEENPVMRETGTGEHFKEEVAQGEAELHARGKFARRIATEIITEMRLQASGDYLYSGDTQSGNSVQDEDAELNSVTESLTHENVLSMVVKKVSKYNLPNRRYKVYVCMEYDKSMAELAETIAKQVDQRISDEVKAKRDYRYEKFRKEMEEKLQKRCSTVVTIK